MAKEFVLVPRHKYEHMEELLTKTDKTRTLSNQDGGENDSPIKLESSEVNRSQDSAQDDTGSPILHHKADKQFEREPPQLYVKRPLSQMGFYKDDNVNNDGVRRKRRALKPKWINYTI